MQYAIHCMTTVILATATKTHGPTQSPHPPARKPQSRPPFLREISAQTYSRYDDVIITPGMSAVGPVGVEGYVIFGAACQCACVLVWPN